MFKIKSYLQYRNTPDGEPRVIIEKKDFWIKTESALCTYDLHNEVALLADCRPLLTVEIDGVEWTEGDIILKENQFGIFYFNEEGGNFMFEFSKYGLSIFDLVSTFFKDFQQFNFADDPAEYSKLLWKCSEKEGWEKIFKLLKIKSYANNS
jgi:hypothetical protein